MKTMKKRIATIALSMVLGFSFAGCGNGVPAADEKDSEKMTEEVTEISEDVISLDEIITDASEPVGQNVEADKPAEQTAESVETITPIETDKPAQTAESVVSEKPVETEKPAETKQPVETARPEDNLLADASGVFVCDYCGYKTPDFWECLAHVYGHEQVMPSDPASSQTTSSETAESESTGSEQSHEHNWIAHTDQRWVSQIVTVVDEPERYEEYDVYGIYWYNTGEWEETRDPNRYAAWWRDKEGGPTSESASFKNYEDNPLFLGYDDQGHAMFQGDHVIRTEYDRIPAVTHEEDQGYYETYVDYYYCDCGATK